MAASVACQVAAGNLLPLCVFTLLSRCAAHQAIRVMSRPRIERARVRDTASNRLALLLVLVEWWQLSALSFGEGLPYDTSGIVLPLSTPPPTARWSVNGALLLGLVDLRLLLLHATDQATGIVFLSLTSFLWLLCRLASRLAWGEGWMGREEGEPPPPGKEGRF